MSTSIYYFSATGNSLITARIIANRLNARLISIPKVMNSDRIVIDAERIGLVFPSYMAPVAGLPLIIERFIKRIANIGSLHIFAVCTCGGYECVNALPSLHKLKKVIQSCGGRLSEEYSVRLPMNNLDYDHIPVPIIRDTEIIIKKSKLKVDQICYRIAGSKGTKFRIVKVLFYLFMKPLYKTMRGSVIKALKEKAKEPTEKELRYDELMPLSDKSIIVNDNCKGCGICTKVCPVKNIVLVNKRPEFQHHCEMCFACDEWCPSGAIRHWSRAEGVKYHHPETKLADFTGD